MKLRLIRLNPNPITGALIKRGKCGCRHRREGGQGEQEADTGGCGSKLRNVPTTRNHKRQQGIPPLEPSERA